MSKVYSFRLSRKNPREYQAREVIEIWISKGYSLRYILIQALIGLGSSREIHQDDIDSIAEKINEIIVTLDGKNNSEKHHSNENALSTSFIQPLKKSAKSGINF